MLKGYAMKIGWETCLLF